MPNATSEEERRLYARYNCMGLATCELIVGDGVSEYRVDDLSRGGIRIAGRGGSVFEHFTIGQRVRISSARASEHQIFKDIPGVVVWFGSFKDDRIMGIRFDAPLESKLDAMLRLFLESEMARDVAPPET